MNTEVKFFMSTQSGAPSMSNTLGSLISVLDACLVDGFGLVTLDSLEVASDVATGTLSTGHKFVMQGLTGPVISIAGATPSSLNGEWRLASVPNANTFTFITADIDDQVATGTITANMAPAGWTKLFSGTNKAVYQRTALGATAMLLRVSDDPVTYPELTMYESMSDVDTGTGASSVRYTMRASGPENYWRLAADAYTVWFWTNPTSSYWTFSGFGDLASPYIALDDYACVLRGAAAASTATYATSAYPLGSSTSLVIARDETLLGASVAAPAYSHGAPAEGRFGSKLQPWPAADGRIHTHPVEVWGGASAARGIYPGVLDLVHASPGTYDGNVVEADNAHTLFIQKLGNSTNCGLAIDLTGPWR